MQNDLLTAAAVLSDRELMARLPLLARAERHASAELVAHLAELDARPRLYAADGHGSLFAYCTRALRLSEDAACNRIEAARACARFPQVLELLASGALSLTAIRLLGRHLTPENHATVLARAANRTRREIEALIAELAPRPDAPTLVRRLPAPAEARTSPARAVLPLETTAPVSPLPVQPAVATHRPAIAPLAPERFRVQFTLGPEAHARLRTLQQLLRREIPSGDVAQIVDRALVLLLEKVASRKL
ncbi:MAG TPA: hypothetical protein VFO85_05295, partial [Vicinamibacteria bacterium]|nr:hypothetical protein [Vicinamibacteria bacterium]